MLHDFLLLELYFGPIESAQFIEDAARKYGWSALKKALAQGFLTARRIGIGPEEGRTLCWLTPQGRAEAQINA